MKAQRIPIPADGDIFAAVAGIAGAYCGPADGSRIIDGKLVPVRRVAFSLPDLSFGVAHCQEPPHKFTEEPDGSLTITASILVTHPRGDQTFTWHGYLTKGEWVTA